MHTGQRTEAVVELVGLSKRYGDHVAVDGVSLAVQRGEIFGIVGANGAGKTTLVECAQGLRRADRGHVRVLGHDPVADRAALRGRVGSQLQDSSLPERLRVGEAIRLFADSRDLAERAMSEWQLTDIVRTPFDRLSGGQRQQLFLALALMNKPEVVFLDELTQGLDPDARRSVWRLIEKVRSQGTTVVLVTHFMEEAEVLCDRIVVIRQGRVVAEGSPQHVIEQHGGRVHVTVADDGAPTEWLRSLPGVIDVAARGNDLVISCTPSGIAHIGSALVAHDDEPRHMHVTHPSLDEALLNLLQHESVSVTA